jgi:adenylate cyclase
LPPELTLALHAPALARIRPGHLEEGAELEAAGARFLVTFKGLGRTQGWRVGVVVPESLYLAGLVAARNRLLAVSGGLLAAALLAGGLTLRSVRRGLGEIVVAAQRMAAFDFAPLGGRSSFHDVRQVMASVELAKTALRAMSKYVPVDLVRHLYQTRREPVLGGEPAEVTLLFTDIEGFTRWSESLDPNELALLLGRYLETMTRAIHSAEGVIDKYIGDAVMAVWNAAAPCNAHETKACRAVIACQEAAQALFGSPAWDGRPALVTRFGIHRDRVMVGHFGAPDRMSFTALGDGVNLASRLEALNKQYGTRVIASEAVYERARDAFAFRLLDRVAVKGKTRGVRVYELLGPAGAGAPAAHVQIYEQALAAYWSRDFEGALALLRESTGDPPSAVLAERCRACLRDPPAADWDGTFVSAHK